MPATIKIKNLKEQIDGAGMNISELARKARVSRGTIEKVLRGGEIKESTASRIQRALIVRSQPSRQVPGTEFRVHNGGKSEEQDDVVYHVAPEDLEELETQDLMTVALRAGEGFDVVLQELSRRRFTQPSSLKNMDFGDLMFRLDEVEERARKLREVLEQRSQA